MLKGDKMDLSIIIVNYQTYNLTKQTIDSIITKEHPFKYEIYLVDNASHDGSLERLQKDFARETETGLIKVIANNRNSGFAYANNLALKESNARYVLLLNSDTIILNRALAKCINHMKADSSIGALGCKVLLPDGSLDKACRRSFPTFSVSFYRMTGLSSLFPKSKRFGKYNLTFLDENQTYEVDCLMGAFMMVRSDAIQEVGLLDGEFFMYGEDIDWCYRIKSGGWKVVYYSDAEIIHYKGGSNNNQMKSKLIHEFYRAMHLFYNKHYRDNYPFIITGIIYMGIWGSYSMKILLNRLKNI